MPTKKEAMLTFPNNESFLGKTILKIDMPNINVSMYIASRLNE